MPAFPRPVFVVAVGGFDPSGGAGVVRDFLTARTFGATVRLIPTAWTEQSATGVRSVEPREREALTASIREILRAVGADEGVTVKVGMLPDEDTVAAVAAGLSEYAGPIVFDPVLSASNGGALFTGDLATLAAFGSRATLVTPNAVEAGALTGTLVRSVAEAEVAGNLLCARGMRAVLVKGGHAMNEAGEAVDVLIRNGSDQQARHFRAPRVWGPSVRGTGCALATAIAVGLGRGLTLEKSIADAKEWLTAALARPISAGAEWHLGIANGS